MKGHLIGCLVAAGVLAAQPIISAAAAVKQLGGSATSDDIIQALTPPAGGGIRTRGLTVVPPAAPSASAPAKAEAPAVAIAIRFELNSAALTDDAKAVIKKIGEAMMAPQLAHYRFLLEGHTDTTGTPDYNMALSEERAQAVRDYLVKTFGVPQERLDAVGRGEKMLLDPANPTSAVNRRVQIVNLGG